MCGICGFYQHEGEADRRVLTAMNESIHHRGPDEDGYFFEGHVGMGMRRLCIIDLETGQQPMHSNSKKHTVTFNGEIYNFMELRKELEGKGFKFRTQCDTEVIINLYEAYGTEFVKKLRGMFAIGIYDKEKERLVVARDHVGIKPLYYCIKPGNKNLVYGSEIKAILQYPGISREIDPQALDWFLTLEYIPAPFSIFKHIRKLPAGHILVYGKGMEQPKIERYWEVRNKKHSGEHNGGPPDFNALKEEFHALLNESVKLRMISDVPLGAFLSGGIDSSAIVSAMASQSDQKIKTFSIGFEEKSYSELKYSSQVSEIFGTDHYTKTLSPDINELVLYLADFWDEPLGDFSNFPTYLVSKTAREKVTVVLSGDGGDEIFGGYEHYIAQKVARFIDFPLFRPFHKLWSNTTHLFPPSELKKGFVNRIKRFSEGLHNSHGDRHFRWMIFLSNLQKKKLYAPGFLDREYLKPLNQRATFDEFFRESQQFDGINQDLYLDFNTYMVDNILVKVDRMSMATSLEARVPLLDYKMVEFAFSLPDRFKLGGSTTKWFFKKAMEGILPDEIIYRRKEGFSIPIKNWLKTDLKDLMMENLSEKRVKEAGFFNHSYIEKMKTEHLTNKQNHAHRLWPLILFNLWRERFAV
ncbi:MAG: asparagine synthase (glutamine-hydrolyzing) [bacterium]|nr:asparagine synthase (glutamine-hydrolyzing) [bacterium]